MQCMDRFCMTPPSLSTLGAMFAIRKHVHIVINYLVELDQTFESNTDTYMLQNSSQREDVLQAFFSLGSREKKHTWVPDLAACMSKGRPMKRARLFSGWRSWKTLSTVKPSYNMREVAVAQQ